MKLHAFRLVRGQDLRQELMQYCRDRKIQSAFVVTCVGSLSPVVMRMAGAKPNLQDVRVLQGDFEIISLTGTFAGGEPHLHLGVADRDGVMWGGHLKDGSIVQTTAEVVLGVDETHRYSRAIDSDTGFAELSVGA